MFDELFSVAEEPAVNTDEELEDSDELMQAIDE
jgi:hypothetical protein